LPKNKEELFRQVVKEACRDAKISPEEFKIIKRLAELLGYEIEQANKLAAGVIDTFKAGKLEFDANDNPEELYRNLLLSFSEDNVIDGHEAEILDQVKRWLKITLPEEQAEPAQPIIAENGDITPLRCDECNGQVPLLRQPSVKCPYCKATKTIPDAYLEALASRTSFKRRRQQAKALYEQLGKPPTTLEKALSEMNERAFVIAFVGSLGLILAIVQALIFYPLNWFYATFYSLNMIDAISVWIPGMISTAATFCLSVIPFILLYRIRRKVLSLKHLKVALAATPPDKAGAPVTCRSCGSPLEVAKNSAGVTCPYCQTDNLLHIPSEWLSETRDTSIKVGKSAFNAQKVFKKETMLAWESVLSVFLLFLVIGALNYWFISFRQEGNKMLPYNEAIKLEPRIYPKEDPDSAIAINDWIMEAQYVDNFFIPIKANEKLTLNWDITSATHKMKNYSNLEAAMFLCRTFTGGYYQLVDKKIIPRNASATFEPPVGGWYRVSHQHQDMIGYKLKITTH
jgi:phage FluMu protein Com